MEKIFFDNWTVLLRTLIVGVLAYIGLITLLRISGKRTLSKMSPFDLIITFALGSILASLLTANDISLAQGILAFLLLIALQVFISRITASSKPLEHLINSQPQLIFYNGQYLQKVMKAERVTEEEIQTLVREQGMSSLQDIEAVVLETNGDFSVIIRSDKRPSDGSAMMAVRGFSDAMHAGPDSSTTGNRKAHHARPSQDGHE